MDRKLKRALGLAIPLAILIMGISYISYIRIHTFTLSGEGIEKSEQIQPVLGSVKVTGTADTSVVFTDIESGETYMVGYITSGMSEKIKLEKGKWYTVKTKGNITVKPINVRISESS